MLKVERDLSGAHTSVLSPTVCNFLEKLGEKFNHRIRIAVEKRSLRTINDLGFDPETESIRENKWKVDPCPHDILDRRVEITGPPDRKMIINALNSGAKVFMADFEDSNSPTWTNCMDGQVNLRDAVERTITYTHPLKNKKYSLNNDIAVLFVRPRGLHLKEKNVTIGGVPLAASLFDFGVYFANNTAKLLSTGTRPYFYLPKLEHHSEAALWADIFSFSEKYFGLEIGTIKATVLIETIPAVFQMNEILFALRKHSVGLNCGRWDYIFSFIKTFKNNPAFVVPDRDCVGMNQHFMRSYSKLLIHTCHKRGAHAMGGMAAQIPIKNDPEANDTALGKVTNDKLREVLDGHDGTWVAHPGLVQLAFDVFNEHMPSPNQISRTTSGKITEEDLLRVPVGECTESMLRKNIRIGYAYLKAWTEGIGCVPLNNLMEDAATAEISRAQIWQWINHEVRLTNGQSVTKEYVMQVLGEELSAEEGIAMELFKDLCTQETMDTFLTLKAYEVLNHE